MNMKKSIAGVMAGAMAVSAMATVVSADQDAIALTYDLKTYVEDANGTKAKVTLVANYEKVLVDAAADYIQFGSDNGFVINETVYDKGLAISTGSSSDLKDLEFYAVPFKNYTLETPVAAAGQTVKLSVNNKTDGSTQVADAGKVNLVVKSTDINDKNRGALVVGGYDLNALGYSNAANAAAEGLSAVTGTVYGFEKANVKLTYEVPNIVKVNNSNSWGWTSTDADDALKFFGDTAYTDTAMNAELFYKGFNTKDGNKKTGVTAKLYDATKVIGSITPATYAIGSFEAGAKTEKQYPFKTTLNPKNNDNNVVTALTSRKAGGNYYTKPIAVINDAIANHTNVTFTFTSYDGYVGTTKSHIYYQWVNEGEGFGYQATPFDWHNPTFGQHLYTNIDDSYSLFDTDDYDMYGSYSSAWGINLFTGAVVVNNEITMQLSDVDTFNWGSNTLTFDWFDITDDGKITDAKTFLKSMLLYTPVDWYWDKLTVVVTDEEREDIDAGAGLEDEAEVIEDEPEVEETEIVEEPEVVETEAETEAAPVETAPSPATGNAPVALAVIPVALAAAAVVAKKRG